MPKLKQRRIIFRILIAILSGGSLVFYAQSEANFFLKTTGLVLFQQSAAFLIYFICFGWDLLRNR